MYGYLPALVRFGVQTVIALERHRARTNGRRELSAFTDCVTWVASLEDVISNADSLVFAVPPTIQEGIVAALPGDRRFESIILEKPIASSADAGKAVLARATSAAASVRVGYSFLYAPWTQRISRRFREPTAGEYLVKWKFMANHFAKELVGWKAMHSLGGGAIRFYGIHLIALLAAAGRYVADSSMLICDSAGRSLAWEGRFSGGNGSLIRIELDCCSPEEQFLVAAMGSDEAPMLDLASPFGENVVSDGQDNRVGVLTDLLASFDLPNSKFYDAYDRTNSLWRQVESITEERTTGRG
jgi:hypothetical protein